MNTKIKLPVLGYRKDGRPIYPIMGGDDSRLAEVQARQAVIRTELLAIEELAGDAERQAEDLATDVARQDELLAEYDTLEAERAPLAERFERIERVRAAAANPANIEPSQRQSPALVVRTDPFENLAAVRFSLEDKFAPDIDWDYESGIIGRAVTALSDAQYRPRGISDAEVESAVRTVETMPGAARHALIHGSLAYRSAFKAWLLSQGNPLYTPEEADAVRAAMSLSGSAGGYTLPTLLDPTLIRTGTASNDPIRSVARVESGTQNVWHGVSVGNVTAYWTAEAAAMTEGSPTFAQPSVTAAKLTAYLQASFEVFEDSSLQGQLPGLIVEGMSFVEQQAFVNGSGSGAPKGIITAISATAGSTVTCATRGTFAYTDFQALHDALPSRYENSSTWAANKVQYTAVRNFSTGSAGSLFWQNLNSNNAQLLIDSPYIKASDMNTATTSGTIFFLIGDWSQFLIYDRIGIQMEFMPQVTNSSGLPTGQRALVAHKRVGSDCTDINAFRFLKG